MKKTKNIQVAVRMRPLLNRYEDHEAWMANSEQKTVSSIPKKMHPSYNSLNNDDNSLHLRRRPSKVVEKTNVYEFSYDYVFSENQKNQQVYSESCKKLVQQFLKGKNASIFMYGQTTSGKTYTMLGDGNQQGLIIHSLKDVFRQLQKFTNEEYTVLISYMQIYNEQINDLLNPEGLNLRIVDDHPHNLSEFMITSYNQAMELLQEGEKLRSYAEKNFHDHSSRSHTIFQIKLIENDTQSGRAVSKNVLNLVDLAGSERVGDEDSNEQTGYINKSLFVLSNVIHKLSQKKSGHVPFRDSKLTRVLSSSLTTSSHTIFICTISPAEINFTQTLSTLRFANQSRKVQLKSVEDSTILNESSFIIQQKQINKLRQENVSLRKNLSQKQKNESTKQISMLDQTLGRLQEWIGQVNKENDSNNVLNKRSGGNMIKFDSQATISKLHTLYDQYKRNVQILEKEYVKAMINLTSTDLKIDKEAVKSKIAFQQMNKGLEKNLA